MDRGLLGVGDSPFELGRVLSADSNEAGGAENAVTGREVGLLLENVAVLSRLLGVLDLTDPLALGRVRDALSQTASGSRC